MSFFNCFKNLFSPKPTYSKPHKTLPYSETHLEMAKYLKTIDVLTRPQDFLGPNWEKVLAFWFFIDYLSEEEKNKIIESYQLLSVYLRRSIESSAVGAAISVVCYDYEIAAYMAAYHTANGKEFVFSWASLELIGNDPNKLCYSLIMG
jgi:hypothetical protein